MSTRGTLAYFHLSVFELHFYDETAEHEVPWNPGKVFDHVHVELQVWDWSKVVKVLPIIAKFLFKRG